MVQNELARAASEKYERLVEILSDMDGAVVAFSGGVDSTLLLAAAVEALGDRVLAVSGLSPSYPEREVRDARDLALRLGARLRTIETDEMSDPAYFENPKNRCFHCKSHLFDALLKIADEEGCECVLDGTNADDAGDFRPGIRAAREKGVTSPLMEVGLAKEEIRILLKRKGLPVWNKPAQACLASRIPYGQDITEEKLKRISIAEDSIRGLGFLTVRVRHWGHLAVVEVGQGELDRLFEKGMREKVKAATKAAGFKRVAFDSDGYLSGSLNLTLAGPPSPTP
jgi:uncharacterized protein